MHLFLHEVRGEVSTALEKDWSRHCGFKVDGCYAGQFCSCICDKCLGLGAGRVKEDSADKAIAVSRRILLGERVSRKDKDHLALFVLVMHLPRQFDIRKYVDNIYAERREKAKKT